MRSLYCIDYCLVKGTSWSDHMFPITQQTDNKSETDMQYHFLENARIELAASRMRSERSTPELKKAACQIPQVELSFSIAHNDLSVQCIISLCMLNEKTNTWCSELWQTSPVQQYCPYITRSITQSCHIQ